MLEAAPVASQLNVAGLPGDEERLAWAVLSATDGLGPVAFVRLIDAHGSASAVLATARGAGGADELVKVGLSDLDGRRGGRRGLDEALATAVVGAAMSADKILARIRRLGLEILTTEDAGYPPRLLAMDLPPPVLFVRGDRNALVADRSVAVVGTRRATEGGRWAATLIADAIARHGGVVVSGLAIGIDGAAHWAAVHAHQPTVAVLGSGHGRLYPRAHGDLAEKILEGGGAVISEFEPDVRGSQWTFPRRNRVISGLATATVVVEAPAGSGALITAGWALEQGRDCFVVPGALGSANSVGGLEFLREYHGQARIVSTVRGLIEDLGWHVGATSTADAAPLGSVEGQVAAIVAEGVATVDGIVARTGLSVATVLSTLTLLEMRGLVAAAYGRYRPQGLLMPSAALERSSVAPRSRRSPISTRRADGSLPEPAG